LYDYTGDEKYLLAAKRIAQTYRKNQMENGSWYLFVNHETGKPIAENIVIPTAPVNYFIRLKKDYKVTGLEEMTEKAMDWIMENPVRTFNWQGQFEDVKAFAPYKRQSREQACDLAMYLFNNNKNYNLAEELVRFAEDQFVIWEKPLPIIVGNKPKKDVPSGWNSKYWITPSVQEQYGFFMPVNRTAAIMIETYWAAYTATKKEIYLAKAQSIANAITLVQKEHDGDYPTMFTKFKMNFWLNSVVYPAKTMMKLEKNLQQLKK
jgi:maltose/maltodextrin transport system substrate-binding protein